jgi:hypothetical protein
LVRLLGGELHRRIQSRVDVQSAFEHHVGAVLALERLLHELEEVLAGGAPALGGDETEIRARQLLGVGVLERAVLDEATQHDFATALGGLGMVER